MQYLDIRDWPCFYKLFNTITASSALGHLAILRETSAIFMFKYVDCSESVQ